MTLELFAISGSPYTWRVQLALESKRIPHTVRMLSISDGELESPSYLALNPRGRVPTLVDGDFVLTESLAMLAYLETKWPEPPLLGRSAQDTGNIWRVMAEYTSYVDESLRHFILPLYRGRGAELADQVRSAIVVLGPELARYETQLARTQWLVGDEVTAADFCVFPHVQSILRAASKDGARAFEIPFLPLGPNLDRWRLAIEALPGYERTVPPHWR